MAFGRESSVTILVYALLKWAILFLENEKNEAHDPSPRVYIIYILCTGAFYAFF